MKKLLLILLLISCQAFANPVAGNDQESINRVKTLATKGDAHAQVQLGNIYETGRGAKQNFAEAIKWYRIAANKGDATGQFMLGEMYETGKGVRQSLVEALKWYRLAADQGNQLGQYRLGQMFSEGLGVRQSYSEAATWFRMAASQGSLNAQYALGGMYRSGLGVVQDHNEALKWYQMAAAKGDAKSKAAMDSMQIDMAARQRVLDEQQRVVRGEDVKRQQEADLLRQALQMQQQRQQQQQQEQERDQLRKDKCLKDAKDIWCYVGCTAARGNASNTCQQNCEERERAKVAACNGVFIPPAQQIIIQQAP